MQALNDSAGCHGAASSTVESLAQRTALRTLWNDSMSQGARPEVECRITCGRGVVGEVVTVVFMVLVLVVFIVVVWRLPLLPLLPLNVLRSA